MKMAVMRPRRQQPVSVRRDDIVTDSKEVRETEEALLEVEEWLEMGIGVSSWSVGS